MLGRITFEFDDWLVGTFSGNAALGFYSRAYALAKIPMDIFGGVIGTVSLPLYSRSLAAGREVMVQAYERTTWLLTRVVFLSSIVMLAGTEEVVRIIMVPQWLPLAPLVRLMFLFVLGRPLFQNNSILLITLREEKRVRILILIQAVILLMLGPLAVLRWGAEGVSAVVSIMMLIGLTLSEWYTSRKAGVRALPLYVLPAILAAILTPLLYQLGLLIPAGAVVLLIVKGLLAVAVFGSVTLLLERQHIREAIRLVRSYLFKTDKDLDEIPA